MSTKKKLEKKILVFFNENANDVLQTIVTLRKGDHPSAAIDLGKKFIWVCKQILLDPRFNYMNQVHQIVQQKILAITDQMTQIESEESLTQSNDQFYDEKFLEHYKPLYSHFYANVDQIHHELIEEMTEKPENEFEHYWRKSRILMKSRVIRKFTPSQEKIISNFKKSTSPAKLEKFKVHLSLRQELKLYDDYRIANEYYIVDIEDKGWFNTVILYCKLWINYMEKIIKFHVKHNRDAVIDKIQKEIDKLRNYILKIEKKYSKNVQLDVNQTSMLNDSIQKIILSYKRDRREMKKYQFDRNILKQIKSMT